MAELYLLLSLLGFMIIHFRKKESVRSVYLCAPGVHGFLFVVPFERFSDQEEETLQQMKNMFVHKREQSPPSDRPNMDELRILMGKTGVGKSATENLILGRDLRKECLYHTLILERTDAGRSDRNTIQGENRFKLYRINTETMYGKDIAKCIILVLTQSDQLEGKSVEEFIRQDKDLSRFNHQSGDRYHVKRNRDLVQKSYKIDQNGGRDYTNQMIQKKLRFRQEEKKRRKTVFRGRL